MVWNLTCMQMTHRSMVSVIFILQPAWYFSAMSLSERRSSGAHHHVASTIYQLLRSSLAPMSSHPSHQCESWESTSTQIYRRQRIFPRLCQLVSQSSVKSEASVGLSLDQSSSRWLHLWCSPDWTMVARQWLVYLHGNSTDYGPS